MFLFLRFILLHIIELKNKTPHRNRPWYLVIIPYDYILKLLELEQLLELFSISFL